MTEVCLINILGAKALCIQEYVIYGILLIFAGILIATFIQGQMGKKIGLSLIIIGLILSIGFSLIVSLWTNSVAFRYISIGAITFIVAMFILFQGKSTNPIKT